MKENIYDKESFYEKYSKMERSQKGLAGAGEWRTLERLMPDFAEKRLLDLGCGYGWHCMYAAEKGAKKVTGIDLSEKMLETARQKTKSDRVEYLRMAMEDVDFPADSFDIVFSSLAFHYVRDYKALVEQIYRMLAPGGVFLFSVEHPVFTAYGSQDWYYDGEGGILHFPVDNYFYEGGREAVFLGEKVTKYHRTLTVYLNTLLETGFILQNIVEPQPPEDMMALPGMKDEMRRPMMLIIKAVKK